MTLEQKDLEQYLLDPNKIQIEILDYIQQATNDNLTIVDPTNPFNMLLESTVVSAANAAIEMKTILKKLYPNLATDKKDLYHHLADNQLLNMFAIPSRAKIVFYLNTIEIKLNGYRAVDKNYYTVTIPEYTEVTVADTKFTLLNDVDVRLYDDGTVFAEELPSDNDLAVNTSSILNTAVISDNQSVSWVIVEVEVPQITRNTLSDTITLGESYKTEVNLTDQYVYSEVMYKNENTNNKYAVLNKTHSEEFIDPYTPTVFISNTDETVTYSIPDVYLLNGLVSGNIEIIQYETKGKIYLPINNYTLNDYSIKLGNTGKNNSTAAISNVTLLANSGYPVEGGKNATSMSELKESVIYNTTGDIDLPITEFDIKQKASYYDFEIFKVLDVITDRIYIASKNLPTIKSDLLFTKADIFFNTVEFILKNLNDTSNVIVTDDYFIIKSNSVFEEKNGKVYILNDYELDKINSLTMNERVIYYNDKKYYFTPYYYITDKIDTVVNSRVYNLDQPKVNKIVVKNKNGNITNTISINEFIITKVENGYNITITLNGDEIFNNMDQNGLRVQLTLPLAVGDSKLYYNGIYNLVDNKIEFTIETDHYVNIDNDLHVLNGVSDLRNKDIKLNSKAEVYIYTTDTSYYDENLFLLDYIYDRSGVQAVLVKEEIDFTLGKELDYIWNKVTNSYTERKYLKYEQDIPLVYTEDVYEKDPETGTIFKFIDEDNDGVYDNIEYTILHHKGDPVLDNEGNQLYKHKKGDIVTIDDIPVVDQDGGVVRYLDIFMLEYEYKIATNLAYKNYLELVKDNVNEWINDTLPELNKTVLENTKIVYKSYKNNKQIKISINDVKYSLPYVTRPEVDLYTYRDKYSESEIFNIKVTIGKILHEVLDGMVISQSDIRNKIIDALGSEVVGVKIKGLDNIGDLEVFSIDDKTTRLVLDKKLDINKNNELVVHYNLKLNLHSV